MALLSRPRALAERLGVAVSYTPAGWNGTASRVSCSQASIAASCTARTEMSPIFTSSPRPTGVMRAGSTPAGRRRPDRGGQRYRRDLSPF